ncbi:Carnitine dehydratase [Vibrio crassostreae]|nr:Carnitine dehydratase [Vibrio crassostreae]CAK2696378.1 Carnitine dehydratase [Vibrio crassostreae]CAK2697332.1 Carnitine dehydratase [Vibrio crassostreae]CAK2700627.1 Carnitine dehydratase [Vibrio crassostreae]CAK2704027.1 Carnitine dehydratase [Vibrio crassostreae]
MLQALENLKEMVGIDIAPSITYGDINNQGPAKYNLVNWDISDAYSSLIMMQGLLVANIWEKKTGEGQHIEIDHERAMEQMYRPFFIHVNGKPQSIAGLGRHTSLTHKTKDGRFIETMNTFNRLHEKTLEVLDCSPSKDKVDAAYASKTAQEWEEHLNAEGLSCAIHRTKDEFRATEQGQYLESITPFEVTPLGTGFIVPFQKSERPLSDIRIVDLSHVLAGPSMSNLLAEQGANVIHVSNPGAERVPLNVLDTSHGKKNVELDLNTPEDLAILKELIQDADIFVNGYSPSRLQEKFGLSFDSLTELNPNLIIVTESMYGGGPWANRPGWENLGQAVTGMMMEIGTEEQPLHFPYGALNDYSTGIMGAIGVLKALHIRATEGGSQHVSAALTKTAMWFQDQPKTKQVKSLPAYKQFLGGILKGGHDSEHSIDTPSPFGVITHLKPVLEYSKTPAYWDKPASPLGSSYPSWDVK